MAMPRWARKGRMRTISAYSILVPDKCPGASAMSFSKLVRHSSSTDFSLCGLSLGVSGDFFGFVWLKPKEKAHRLKSVRLMACNKRARGTTLGLVCFLLAVFPARATTYYVAAAGSDANTGTDTAHAWQTIAKVNGSAFVAG